MLTKTHGGPTVDTFAPQQASTHVESFRALLHR
jgi:hypothetical protein